MVDAEDVLSVVRALVHQGVAHASKVVIQGGSAGGFTVLNALVTSTAFAAGASYYGVADMLALASDTHDFESRYLDSLLGPLPQLRDVYIQRSPLTHVGNMSAPLILFQGSEDKVVPPSQSEIIRDACAAKGLKCKCLPPPPPHTPTAAVVHSMALLSQVRAVRGRGPRLCEGKQRHRQRAAGTAVLRRGAGLHACTLGRTRPLPPSSP